MATAGLPQVVISGDSRWSEKPLILVAGGRKPDMAWLRGAAAMKRGIWAVDKGLEYCMEAHLVPDLYVGDRDSVSDDAFRRASRKGTELMEFPSAKNRTDLQLALSEAGERFPGAPVLVTGAWGGRFDHMFSAVFSLVWSLRWNVVPWGVADEKEILLLLYGPVSVSLEFTRIPRNLSLFSLSEECCGVSAGGVRWGLEDANLVLEEPYAVSNVVLPGGTGGNEKVGLSVGEGLLGLYLDFGSEEKRGLS